MFPEALLDVDLEPRGWVRPRYLSGSDHLWVQQAIDELDACVDRPADEVLPRLARPPDLGERPRAWRALVRVLLGERRFELRASRPPTELRHRLFLAAAAADGREGREQVVARAAAELGLPVRVLEADLYADLPGERRLAATPLPSAGELILRYNLVLAQSLLLRCEHLRVRLQANVRGVVRFARLQRLLCLARTDPSGDGTALLLSGPLSLFHHTTKYGRAMAAWLPVLMRTPRWELEASCRLGGERRVWRSSFRDPLGTTHAPLRRFDSALEERFFRDLRRSGRGWEVIREADPIQIGAQILCPDFTLVEPRSGLRVPVELVGYWTPEYLAGKLALVRRLPPDRPWVFCVDRELAAAFEREETAGPFFYFKRRIPVDELLAFIVELEGRRSGENIVSRGGTRESPP